MRFCGHCVVLTLLLHFLNGELILVRKQDEVYCMESNSSNKALTWIPTIERNKKITYEEEVLRIPVNEDIEEFRHLNCNLMRDGGCPLADKHTKSWEIIEHASDDYGFISDRRWHVLQMYNTSGDHREMQKIIITKKGHIYMSILAKNNAIITAFDDQRGYILIKLDAHVYTREGGRRNLAYCPRTLNKKCNDKKIATTFGSTLKDGEGWKNVKIAIEKKGDTLLIRIDNDVLWNVPNIFDKKDDGIFQVKNLFITTGNQQMGFWKFHDYKVLRLKERGNPLTLDFETRNNPQLCLSILYHSGGSHERNPIAAEMKIASDTETIRKHLEAGKDWQEYRHVFQLKINMKYQLSLMPMEFYSTFAIGEIRVCHEREYSVTKMRISREVNISCAILNEDKTISETKSEQVRLFSYACLQSSFGENCDIKCSEFGSDNCKGLRVCSTRVCSCLPGYNGTNCESVCNYESAKMESDINYIFLVSTVILGCACIAFIIFIIITKMKRNRPSTPAVEADPVTVENDVVYDEIDLSKAVPPPDPELRPRVREVPGYLGVMEPYHYDVIREPQPLWPWMKRFAPRNVDQDGYEVPVSRRNVAESSH